MWPCNIQWTSSYFCADCWWCNCDCNRDWEDGRWRTGYYSDIAGCAAVITVAHWDNYKHIRIDPGQSDLIKNKIWNPDKKENTSLVLTFCAVGHVGREGRVGCFIFCPRILLIQTWNISLLTDSESHPRPSPDPINSNTCLKLRPGP